MLLLIVLLLVPILLLYGLSNRVANQVVQSEIQSSNMSQLLFFLHQLDSAVGSLSMFPVILSRDPHIRDFVESPPSSVFEGLRAQAAITEKLGLQSVSSLWANDLTIAFPRKALLLSSNIYLNGKPIQATVAGMRNNWTYEEDVSRSRPIGSFVREVAEPAAAASLNDASAVYQVRFSVQNMTDMLDTFKKDRQSDPFLFQSGRQPIWNSTSDHGLSEAIIRQLERFALSATGQLRMSVEGSEYLVSYARSGQLGWYLLDYVPVHQALAPIAKARNLFYASAGLLLALGFIASYMLYRNVQIPIMKLTRGMQNMKNGHMSERIEYKVHNEFDYLIQRYNEMAEQIQVLVEDVYAERIRSREATLKQLQSQIHPHFLYNSLFFIINSAMMEDRDSVISMAHNLAEYYRYTTHVDQQAVLLQDELEFIKHYLEIQNLRMHRLEFRISVPDAMLDETVPRLILQPLVENAIVHGIENKNGKGRISITGEQTDTRNRIVVEDNGIGMSEERISALTANLNAGMSEDIGCGTWNVHQRLLHQFGEGSGVAFERSSDGGIRATLTWNRKQEG